MKLGIGDFPVTGGNYPSQVRHGFRPRRDLKAVMLSPPVDWSMDPFRDRNWRFQLHAWRMLPAIWSEVISRQRSELVAEEVLPWIRDWHRYHVVEGLETEMTWHDMATGIRAQHLALLGFLQSRGELSLEAADYAVVHELAAEHMRRLLDEEFIARGNHAIFQLVGLRLLGEIFPNLPGAAGEAEYSAGLMARLLKSQFGPLSVHVENSPSYHHFAVQQFGRINPCLFPALEARFRRTLAAAREVEPWFGMPDGSITAFGDSEGASKATLPESVQGDLEAYSDEGRRILVKDLSSAGYAIVRTGPEVPLESASMLAIKTQCLSSGHAQADHLTFELFEQGRRLLVDSGKYTYDTTHWRRYFKSDRAHNVVGLVHRDFDPGSTPPGSASMSGVKLSSEGVFQANATVKRSGGFTHSRAFEYVPGRRLRLREQVKYEAGGRPASYFHLAPDLSAVIASDLSSVAVFDASGSRLLTFVFDRALLRPRLVSGQMEPYMQGWYSPSYRVKQPATVLELVARGQAREWTVDIEIASMLTRSEASPAAPWPIHLPDDIAHRVRVRTSRTLTNDAGAREFRMLFEHPHSGSAEMHERMIEAVRSSGYRLLVSGQRQKGYGATFEHAASGSRLRVLVRDADAYPVKYPGMRGTTYLALVEGQALSTSQEAGA